MSQRLLTPKMSSTRVTVQGALAAIFKGLIYTLSLEATEAREMLSNQKQVQGTIIFLLVNVLLRIWENILIG